MPRLIADNEILMRIADGYNTYDDKDLDDDLHDSYNGHKDHYTSRGADSHRRTAIDSYKVGFAFMLGLPIDFARLPKAREDFCGGRNFTMIVLKVLEFIDVFSDIEALKEDIVALILGPNIGREVIARYPTTYMRVPCLLRSKELFYKALVAASNQLMEGRHDRECKPVLEGLSGDQDLRVVVLGQAFLLQRTVEWAHKRLWQ